MKVRVRLFSTLREQFRTAEKEVEREGPTAAREIFVGLFDDRGLAERLLRSTRFAVNCEYVAPETLVSDGDELACIPPVSGG